ncbi:MAG: SOS response-associated peptidase family protein, partial [Nitratireductor sp.]|nr:SOS response-associated peptidase family protein [Nitratireductor sp.]
TWASKDGSEIDSGAILTTAANSAISSIHDRMPVVIKPQDLARWLDCKTQEPRDVEDLMQPVESSYFEAIPISDKVNKVANSGADIQKPVEPTNAREPERESRATKQDRPADHGQMKLF